MITNNSPKSRSARTAVALLLSINIFNYVDRQILAAVEPSIRGAFFLPGDKNALAVSGILGSAFLVTYMLAAPALGWLADRFSRWVIIGLAVIFWSFATAGSGLAATFGILFFTRILVGVGEGGYGPAAPTILADLFPIEKRGRIMSLFFAAIPVGSALGYVIGGLVLTHLTFVPEAERWRWALCLVAVPGILLGGWCLFQRDPRAVHGVRPEKQRAKREDYLTIVRTPSYLFNCGAQTAMTFAAGGIGWWIAAYLKDRGLLVLHGDIWRDHRSRWPDLDANWRMGGRSASKEIPGSYFLVSGWGMICAFPLFIAMLFTPFPTAWIFMFGSVFFLFLNTGPSNTALANVTLPKVRATAFAFNILVLHTLGDVPAFPAIGYVAGHTNWTTAFLVVSGTMLLAGVLWLIGAKFLPHDTARVETAGA